MCLPFPSVHPVLALMLQDIQGLNALGLISLQEHASNQDVSQFQHM